MNSALNLCFVFPLSYVRRWNITSGDHMAAGLGHLTTTTVSPIPVLVLHGVSNIVLVQIQ